MRLWTGRRLTSRSRIGFGHRQLRITLLISAAVLLIYRYNRAEPQVLSVRDVAINTQSPLEGLVNDTLSALHPDYDRASLESESCERRFGLRYLEDFGASRLDYCETIPGSPQLSCFTNHVEQNRGDTFCVASKLVLPSSKSDVKFELGCKLRNWTSSDLLNAPKIGDFYSYPGASGPKDIFDKFIKVVEPPVVEPDCIGDAASHTILIKREDGVNIWQSLLEIFSYSLTIDALHLAKDGAGKAMFEPKHVESTQVVLLDDKERGSYLGLWHLLAKKPIMRITELTSANSTCFKNVIVPLAGRANPLWQGMLESLDCAQSKTLAVFVHRVLDFFRIPKERDTPQKMTITYMDRKFSRKLVDQHGHLSKVKGKYREIEIKMVDFASIPLRDQLITVRNTDVLVGVYGAGLAHAMFLPPGSALVELLPKSYKDKGFRNLAKLRDIHYFSAHVEEKAAASNQSDWRNMDVKMEEDKFVTIMEAAILSVYNRGSLNLEM